MKQETIDRIRKFTDDRDWHQFHAPANLAKSIAIEAGELLECFQWSDTDYDLEHVKEELADVMVYCQNMLDELGLDADEIVNAKMAKNEAKYPVELAIGSAAKYTEYKKKTAGRQDIIFFWKEDEENGCFANMYPCSFVIDGVRYAHVEQYMMAQKARVFSDLERYEAILKTADPAECKQLGRQISPFVPEVWDKVKYDIVKTGNRAKYEQDPALRAALLSTGDAAFAEASPYDKIWGIGLSADAPEAQDPSSWPGENLLGKILAEIRAELAQTV